MKLFTVCFFTLFVQCVCVCVFFQCTPHAFVREHTHHKQDYSRVWQMPFLLWPGLIPAGATVCLTPPSVSFNLVIGTACCVIVTSTARADPARGRGVMNEQRKNESEVENGSRRTSGCKSGRFCQKSKNATFKSSDRLHGESRLNTWRDFCRGGFERWFQRVSVSRKKIFLMLIWKRWAEMCVSRSQRVHRGSVARI